MGVKNTATGNRVILKYGGEAIGTVQNCSFTDDFSLQEADGMGDLEVQEHVPGKITHRIDFEKYFVAADTLQKLGMVPTSDEWMTAPELSIEVIDTVTKQTVESYTGVKFNSHTRRYTKHQITGETGSCVARHRVPT